VPQDQAGTEQGNRTLKKSNRSFRG